MRFHFLLAFILVTTLLSGCFETPRVQDPVRKIASFTHVGLEKSSCLQCHEKDRPVAVSLPVSTMGEGGSPDPKGAVNHGDNADCLQCHRAGGSWKDVEAFDHRPPLSACVSCHEGNRPAPVAQVVHGSGADCVGCHRAGTLWKDLLSYSHLPLPTDCRACHEVNRPKNTVMPPPAAPASGHFGAQDCSVCHVTTGASRPFAFQHLGASGKQVLSCLPCHEAARKTPSHYTGQDCAGCHLDSSKTWLLSVASPHPTNKPILVSCNGCHESARPATTQVASVVLGGHFSSQDCVACHEPKSATLAVFRFSHTANGRSQSSCAGCHEARRPSAEHYPGKDCVSCHTDPAKPWQLPSASPHPQNSPMPLACNTCHAAERPATTRYPGAQNAVQGHFGAQDCISCHEPANGTNVTTFRFAHEPGGRKISTCLPCHEPARPSSNHYAGQDCMSCHADPTKPWAETIPSPHPANSPTLSQCNSCHEKDRPAVTTHPGASAPVSGHFATNDCLNCHEPRSESVSAFLFDHRANGIPRTTCLPCHESQRPIGIVNRFDHSPFGLGDCITCHKQPGASWSGGLYGHSPVPNDCSSCHAPDRPATTVYPGSSTRITGHYTAKDCTACHRPQGGTITRFVFGHSNYLNQDIRFCLPCHTAKGQSKHRNDSKVSFVGDGNCYDCHKKRRSWSR